MKIAYWYKKHKAIPLVDAALTALRAAKVDHYFFEGKVEEGTEVILAIGGDGTLLTLLHEMDLSPLPVLAINGGTLGFLSQEYASLDSLVARLKEGDYSVTDYPLLAVRDEDGVRYALNDVVLSRGTAASTVDVLVEVDHQHVYAYRGDGVIATTPLGSTGYSLSAGGSVLSPALNAIGITPLSAHTLCARPLVVEPTATVTLTATSLRDGVCLAVDGLNVAQRPQIKLEVTLSDRRARLVTFENLFYDKLTRKLATW